MEMLNNQFNLNLINNCYQNSFGIDLEKYHINTCEVNKRTEHLLFEINKSKRIIFSDHISSSFKLILYNRLVYLIGDKSCYPCSSVVESAYGYELNWVSCVIIPGKVKVKGETDIRKSAIIISMFSELVPEIPNEKIFLSFLEQLTYTFSDCDWFKSIFSTSLYVRLVNFWNYKQKIVRLYELGLLYPLEFVIYTCYKKKELRNKSILKYFIASLAESTNKIFDTKELSIIFNNLSPSEIEDILSVENVRQNVDFNVINDEYFADLLDIDGHKRYPMYIDGVSYIYYMTNRSNSIFKSQGFKNEFLHIIKQNFRALENKLRKEKGYDGVGTYFMEKLLYNKICLKFPNLSIHTQYSPAWLRPQRIDIYIEECKLAIEYHGAQHYLAIDFFGGDIGLELRKELDRKKKKKCFENSVLLIEISYEEDFDYAFESLKSSIIDILKENRL
jgi:hypothetical protein